MKRSILAITLVGFVGACTVPVDGNGQGGAPAPGSLGSARADQIAGNAAIGAGVLLLLAIVATKSLLNDL